MTVEIRRAADVDALLALAGPFLAAREPEHNLVFGILGSLGRSPTAYGGRPYLAVAHHAGDVVGVALRTPPYGPVLSEQDEGAAAAFADDLRAAYDTLPSVLGPKAAAAGFARRWAELTGAIPRLAMEQRVYRAGAVRRPAGVAGRARLYQPADRELVLAWLDAFAEEAMGDSVPFEGADAWLERRLADPDGCIVLWDDAGPVALAASGQATPHGLRVGPVYTPPDRRGRGYGTAVTADVTARALATGRRFCFLFTDLANPTSNAIYVRIGYEPVTDVDLWTLAHA